MIKKIFVFALILCTCTFALAACSAEEVPVVVEPTRPARPSYCYAESSLRKITIHWVASGDDGGSPLLGFVYGICEGEDDEECNHDSTNDFKWRTISTNATTDSTTINNLDANKTYTIRVRSYNAIGESNCFWLFNVPACSCPDVK